MKDCSRLMEQAEQKSDTFSENQFHSGVLNVFSVWLQNFSYWQMEDDLENKKLEKEISILYTKLHTLRVLYFKKFEPEFPIFGEH